ncbi:MAG: putative ABC transporter permease [Treponema sp.]|nr:putative ABC transporter permease [Treponema sp.]
MLFLVLTFLFFAGSLIGWTLEVFWRRFFSKNNPSRRWINPGFLHGPYLPLYGLSLSLLFMLSFVPVERFFPGTIMQKTVLFCVMALCITAVEYVGGLIFIKGMKLKLWDYSNCWGNIQGIICPQYTFYWWLLSGVYYFLIHPKILEWLYWFTNHLAFCLVVGFFYGVFTVDLCYTLNIAAKLRSYAKEKQLVIRYENLKALIQQKNEELREKRHFVFPLKSNRLPLRELLKEVLR